MTSPPGAASLPFTPEVQRDLWLFFGETEDGADLLAQARPTLPPSALGYTGRVHLRLDTPFGHAFMAWRQARAEAAMREGTQALVLNGGIEGTIFGVSLATEKA
jgi:hypothetical protein